MSAVTSIANAGLGAATTSAALGAGDIILSIRSQIPDPVADPGADGDSFNYDTLRRWINDAMRIMATTSPIVQDWYGLQSQSGMDIYEMPNTTLSVEQLWYDLLPCVRAPEALTIYVNKITSRGYYFGPHAIHALPRLQVWPASDRTGSTTTLTAALSATDTSISIASATGFKQMGFIGIDNEIILYRTVNSTTLTISNILRGQAGTQASSHLNGATVTERNIMMKLSRLPVPISQPNDPIEIPLGLTPLIELYVMAKVREAEQESSLALQMRQEFAAAMEKLTNKAQLKGLRQGLQVSSQIGPDLYRGRVFIP